MLIKLQPQFSRLESEEAILCSPSKRTEKEERVFDFDSALASPAPNLGLPITTSPVEKENTFRRHQEEGKSPSRGAGGEPGEQFAGSWCCFQGALREPPDPMATLVVQVECEGWGRKAHSHPPRSLPPPCSCLQPPGGPPRDLLET